MHCLRGVPKKCEKVIRFLVKVDSTLCENSAAALGKLYFVIIPQDKSDFGVRIKIVFFQTFGK